MEAGRYGDGWGSRNWERIVIVVFVLGFQQIYTWYSGLPDGRAGNKATHTARVSSQAESGNGRQVPAGWYEGEGIG